jgi:hypothetical protein
MHSSRSNVLAPAGINGTQFRIRNSRSTGALPKQNERLDRYCQTNRVRPLRQCAPGQAFIFGVLVEKLLSISAPMVVPVQRKRIRFSVLMISSNLDLGWSGIEPGLSGCGKAVSLRDVVAAVAGSLIILAGIWLIRR